MKREPGRLLVEVRASLLTSAAFALLLFPLVAVRVDAVERTVAWRWGNLGWAAGVATHERPSLDRPRSPEGRMTRIATSRQNANASS